MKDWLGATLTVAFIIGYLVLIALVLTAWWG